MRRQANARAASSQPRKRFTSRVPRASSLLKATVGLPYRAREATPGVVFGCGTCEGTAQEPGRVSLLLGAFRQINGAPVTNPPYMANVSETHGRRGQERALAPR